MVLGQGITDIKSSDENGKQFKSYRIWCGMLYRCYSPAYHKTRPTYMNCEVSDEWKIYSKFKRWFDINYIEGYEIDKDLLQPNIENKIHSKETCVFIPQALNTFLQCSNNSNTGQRGVTTNKKKTKYYVKINLYDIENKKIIIKKLGIFTNLEKASNVYIEEREEQANKWKEYMKEKHNWHDDLLDKIK